MVVPQLLGFAFALIGLVNLIPAIVHGNKLEVIASAALIFAGSCIVAIFRK